MELEARKKEIGEILKAERARRALTLEEAQRGTRINKKFIKAVEAGDFKLVPTPVAARGFIRIYASYLGLDPGPLIADFNEKFGPPRDNSLPKVTQAMDNGRKRAFGGKHHYRFAVYLGAVIAAFSLFSFLIFGH